MSDQSEPRCLFSICYHKTVPSETMIQSGSNRPGIYRTMQSTTVPIPVPQQHIDRGHPSDARPSGPGSWRHPRPPRSIMVWSSPRVGTAGRAMTRRFFRILSRIVRPPISTKLLPTWSIVFVTVLPAHTIIITIHNIACEVRAEVGTTL